MSQNTSTVAPVPFTQAYVLRTTIANMQRSIAISSSKTISRLEEFQGNSEKSMEILSTLNSLNKMKVLLDEFQSANPQVFAGE